MNDKDIKLLWLREKWGWMGSRSGYDRVCEHIESNFPGKHKSIFKTRIPFWKDGVIPRMAARLLTNNARNSNYYNIYSLISEVHAFMASYFYRPDIIHITYLESDYGILSSLGKKYSKKLIATSHLPASWWRLIYIDPNIVRKLDALIVLSSDQLDYFSEFLPGRVHFIPHGVDTSFFVPGDNLISSQKKDKPRCIYVGKWLRDTTTMIDVLDDVIKKRPDIQFDMVVPRDVREDPSFYKMSRHKQLSWYAGISDRELLNLYQKADLLVLPLIDSAANNAILEAMSCGLPIITSRVNGITDYTDISFADMLAVGDVKGIVNSIFHILNNPKEKKLKSKAARKQAVSNFDWNIIAKKTNNFYQSIM